LQHGKLVADKISHYEKILAEKALEIEKVTQSQKKEIQNLSETISKKEKEVEHLKKEANELRQKERELGVLRVKESQVSSKTIAELTNSKIAAENRAEELSRNKVTDNREISTEVENLRRTLKEKEKELVGCLEQMNKILENNSELENKLKTNSQNFTRMQKKLKEMETTQAEKSIKGNSAESEEVATLQQLVTKKDGKIKELTIEIRELKSSYQQVQVHSRSVSPVVVIVSTLTGSAVMFVLLKWLGKRFTNPPYL